LLVYTHRKPNRQKASIIIIIIIIIIIVPTSLFLSLLASQAEMAFWLEGPQLRGLLHTCLHAAHHHHHHHHHHRHTPRKPLYAFHCVLAMDDV
jgi:hypothetical protein